MAPRETFYVETLGCPKNAVDSEKVAASLLADGLSPVENAQEADLVVINTCAFIEAARAESIEVTLALSNSRKSGAKVVVTGCMAERYGDELALELPEVDAVIGFAGEANLSQVVLGKKPSGVRDLLEIARPRSGTPWAYVKVAEGCDRQCAFCAIPTFRGKQRSRTPESVVAEAISLIAGGVSEIVLVAQDLAWYGRDTGNPGSLEPLLRSLDRLSVDGLKRIRLLYLYPSEVREPLISAMLELETVVPYFDLSLQHASAQHLRRMKRWGSGEKFTKMIADIRRREPNSTFRSSFILGHPGETEDDHDQLLEFLEMASLDWAGFFPFSIEDGTAAAAMPNHVDGELAAERLRECSEIQDRHTAASRDQLLGSDIEVLVDEIRLAQGETVGRTHREAPEIDGLIILEGLAPGVRPGQIVSAQVVESRGIDLVARAIPTTGAAGA